MVFKEFDWLTGLLLTLGVSIGFKGTEKNLLMALEWEVEQST